MKCVTLKQISKSSFSYYDCGLDMFTTDKHFKLYIYAKLKLKNWNTLNIRQIEKTQIYFSMCKDMLAYWFNYRLTYLILYFIIHIDGVHSSFRKQK